MGNHCLFLRRRLGYGRWARVSLLHLLETTHETKTETLWTANMMWEVLITNRLDQSFIIGSNQEQGAAAAVISHLLHSSLAGAL